MIGPLVLFVTNFVYIFLKAFQQKNVMHDEYKLMVPTSCAMATCEYFMVGTIATIAITTSAGFVHAALNVIAMGLGGGIGSVSASFYHGKMRRRGDNLNTTKT